MTKRIGALLALAAIAAAAALGWQQIRGTTTADWIATEDDAVLAQGREIYDRHCASCHGANLEGQPDWTKRLASGRMPAPPHDASGHTWHHPSQVLFDLVKDGVAKHAPPGYESDMPAFDGTLSDAQIRAVLAYIHSTWPEDVRRRYDVRERAGR
jgi:mono/diheme cytochrome c family protein